MPGWSHADFLRRLDLSGRLDKTWRNWWGNRWRLQPVGFYLFMLSIKSYQFHSISERVFGTAFLCGFWRWLFGENKVIGRLEQRVVLVKQAVHLFELDCDAPRQERLQSESDKWSIFMKTGICNLKRKSIFIREDKVILNKAILILSISTSGSKPFFRNRALMNTQVYLVSYWP